MLALRRYLLALFAVLLLAACDRTPTLPRLSPHDVIAAGYRVVAERLDKFLREAGAL